MATNEFEFKKPTADEKTSLMGSVHDRVYDFILFRTSLNPKVTANEIAMSPKKIDPPKRRFLVANIPQNPDISASSTENTNARNMNFIPPCFSVLFLLLQFYYFIFLRTKSQFYDF